MTHTYIIQKVVIGAVSHLVQNESSLISMTTHRIDYWREAESMMTQSSEESQ